MFMGTYIVFNKNKYNNGNISKETIFKNQERNKGRKGRRKEERNKVGRKERGDGRKEGRGRETNKRIEKQKEKRKNQAPVFEFHYSLSTFGIHTHSEYEFSQLTPR